MGEWAYCSEKSNDNLVVPWPGDTTPLQREQESSDHSQGQECTKPIHGEPFLTVVHALVELVPWWWVVIKEEEDECDSDSSEWQVDLSSR